MENMRHGMSPLDAGMDALKRIVRNYNGDMNRLRFVDMAYYVLRKDGAYAGSRYGMATSPASRIRSPCMTGPGGRRRPSTCSRGFRRNGRRCWGSAGIRRCQHTASLGDGESIRHYKAPQYGNHCPRVLSEGVRSQIGCS